MNNMEDEFEREREEWRIERAELREGRSDGDGNSLVVRREHAGHQVREEKEEGGERGVSGEKQCSPSV